MPVELNKIPEKLPLPEPLNKSRWFIIVVLIILAGGIISLFFWPEGMSTHTTGFWLCTLVIPFFAGIACYAFRLRSYENECDRILWWNHLYQEQHDQQVIIGQRGAALLGKAYITPAASNKLASVLLSTGSQLQSMYSPYLRRSLITAQLMPPLSVYTKQGYLARLERYLRELLHMIQSDLPGLADKLFVRIQHDGVLESDQIQHLWLGLFPTLFPVNELSIETQSDGLMWLDKWLDRREKQVVLSVEFNLFSEPLDHYAESVSALLLASPEWVHEYGNERASAIIHRPVVANDDPPLFEHAALWGNIIAGEPFSLWRTQVKGEQLTSLLKAMDRLGYLPGIQDEFLLDDMFGNPGAATGNIALIFASEHAAATKLPQWVMASGKTVHQLIVQPVESSEGI